MISPSESYKHHPILCLMSSKKQKMSSKSSQASEEPSPAYDHDKIFNAGVAEKFDLISTNRSFIKEKGFHHPDDFFSKNHSQEGMGCFVPTLEACCHDGCVGILNQPSSSCAQEGPSLWGVGRLQCEVY